jgi:aldehyde:ferredoxin oxidoreductase
MDTKQCYGWTGKILWVNLTDRKVDTRSTLDYGPAYIGGRGIAARIGWESIPRGVGAFDPQNLLIIMTGPLAGTTAPFSGRTSVGALSPQGWPHEWFGRSNFGGHWGPSLKYAGYDGLVVEGKADFPITLWIEDGKVSFLDARHLWGKGSMETQARLFKELGDDIRVLTIGQAGENLSRIAIITTETESAAGQGGFGAVMGSKNLKAIAVRGSGAVYIAEPEDFTRRSKAIIHEVRTGGLFSNAKLDEQQVKLYKQRWQACTQQCALNCGWGCRFYNVKGPISGQELRGQFHCVSNFIPGIPGTYYDWKLEFDSAFEIRHLADDYGINHWDLLLGIIPWLKDCQKKGLVSELNGHTIDFNNPRFWADLLHMIAFREGVGDLLAEGGRRAPDLLGFGQEEARPLYAAWGSAGHWDARGDRGNKIVYPFWIVPALQWAVDVRDPFSSAHGYTAMTMHWSAFLDDKHCIPWEKIKSIGKQIYGSESGVDPLSHYEDKEYPAVWHGHRSVMKDSVSLDDNIFPVLLSFNSEDGVSRTEGMVGWEYEYHLFTAATGSRLSVHEFDLACERIFNLERSIQIRNYGRSRKDDESVIPYFEYPEWWQSSLVGEKKKLDVDKFIPLLEKYYQLRGWDVRSGWPTAETLSRLGLPDVARTLAEMKVEAAPEEA